MGTEAGIKRGGDLDVSRHFLSAAQQENYPAMRNRDPALVIRPGVPETRSFRRRVASTCAARGASCSCRRGAVHLPTDAANWAPINRQIG